MAAMWDRLRAGASRGREGHEHHRNSEADRKPYWQPHSQVVANNFRGKNNQNRRLRGSPSGPPPPRPPRQHHGLYNHDLIPASLNTFSSTPTSLQRQEAIPIRQRPESSIYSQPDSPPDIVFSSRRIHGASYTHRGEHDDVSPPSSPGSSDVWATCPLMPEVSPIDTTADPEDRFPESEIMAPPTQSAQPRLMGPIARAEPVVPDLRSNIPTMRRERRKQQTDAATDERRMADRSRQPSGPNRPGDAYGKTERRGPIKVDPRWDPMTGERTTSDRGRPSQVDPVQYAKGFGASSVPRTMANGGDQAQQGNMFGRLKPVSARMGASQSTNATGMSTPAHDSIAAPTSRPPWQGASGREVTVDPVRDTPAVRSLGISPRQNTALASPTSPSPMTSDETKSAEHTAAAQHSTPIQQPEAALPSPPPTDEKAATSPTAPKSQMGGFASSWRKMLPLSQPWGKAQPAKEETTEVAETTHAEAPTPLSKDATLPDENVQQLEASSDLTDSPRSPSLHAPIRRKAAPPSAHAHARIQAAGNENATAMPESDQAWVQPPSRFSVTTYAPSTISSGRESLDDHSDPNRPPMPTPPSQYAANFAQNAKPVQSASPSPTPDPAKTRSAWDDDKEADTVKVTLSKAWMSSPYANSAGIDTTQITPPRPRQQPPPQPRRDVSSPAPDSARHNPALQARGSPIDRRQNQAEASQQLPRVRAQRITNAPYKPMPMRPAGGEKTLPQAPPEISADKAQDRIASFNAQLSSLANRRINISRSIKQMTELMPQDKLMNSAEVIRKREMEKKKVEALRMELAEVQRGEHELGMKLHRAYKRLDQGADCEPTMLWVRRATR